MITCLFKLNGRVKSIDGKDIMTCWKKFNTDFGEAVSEIKSVVVFEGKVPMGKEKYYTPEQFKARLKS
jgi:hypothetical protein